MYTALSVGQLYHPARTSWPETGQYSFQQGQHLLLVALKDPGADEVEAVQQGIAQFAFYDATSFIIFLYQFGIGGRGIPLSDCPFSIHLLPRNLWDLSDPGYDEPRLRAAVTVVLIDANTGIIKALRLTTLSPSMSRALFAAHRKQAEMLWSPSGYEAAVQRLYEIYPTPADLLPLTTERCVGGSNE